jgi:hypothetical protein
MGSLCVGEELKVFRLNIAYTYVRDAFQLLQLAASLSILLGEDALALILFSFTFYLICADYFLQKPLYIFGNDNPLEYGDLFVFALLAVTAIKFIRVLVRPRTSLAAKSRLA